MHILYVYTVVEIECDPAQAVSNPKKHGVSFSEAATALLDELAVVIEDPDALGEGRWVLAGMSESTRLLSVVYTLRDDRIRLISARRATRREAKVYAQRI